MRVYRLTSLRPKPLARLLALAIFRSSLGGSVDLDMIFSFLTDLPALGLFQAYRWTEPSRKDISNRRTTKHPACIEAFRYTPIQGRQS